MNSVAARAALEIVLLYGGRREGYLLMLPLYTKRIIMKVLVAYEYFSKKNAGGARISLQTLLRNIDDPNISFHVYQLSTGELEKPEFISETETIRTRSIPKLWWVNQIYARSQWRKGFENKIQKEDFDLAITQGKLAPATARICEIHNIPTVYFVRSLRLAGYKQTRGSRNNNIRSSISIGDFIQYPFLKLNRAQYSAGLRSSDIVVANSEYTKQRLSKIFDISSQIIYPPITFEDYHTSYNSNGKITMVNPRAEHKGVDIFLDIAKEMRREKFLLVGPVDVEKHSKRASRMSNVEHWEWCDDMKRAYNRSKLMVVPSRFEEPFGRVAAEAMCSGIPCVVSNRGGLPYVVGETGVVVDEVESINAWITAIKNGLKSHNPKDQIQRVKTEFETNVQVAKLQNIINKFDIK